MKSPSQNYVRGMGGFALILVILSVFGRVIAYDFVRWDDNLNVTGNVLMREPWSWKLIYGLFDPQTALRFKPLHWLAFRVIAGFAGMEPYAWHAFGLVLHACATAVVFWVFGMVLRRWSFGLNRWEIDALSWLGAGIWALHPLRVEAVAWVTASTYPMAGVLLAGSFGAYLKAYEGEASGRWLGISWLLAIAAYATYPVTLTYVGWLMAVDVFLLRVAPENLWKFTERASLRWWAKHMLFAAPAGVVVLLTVWTRYTAPGVWATAPGLDVWGWDDRLMAAWALLSVYPAKFFWPSNLTPNQTWLSQTVWLTSWVLVFAAVSTLTACLLWIVKNKRPIWAGLGLGFAALALPCLGLTERATWPVDRYSYVLDMVIAGVSLVGIAWFLSRVNRRWPVVTMLVVVMGVCTQRTCQLLPAWSDSDALFSHMEKHPDFGRELTQQAHIYALWGGELLLQGRYREAMGKIQQVNDIYLGAMRRALAMGDYGRAIWLADGMESDVGLSANVRRERAGWLLKAGQNDKAAEELRRVLREDPNDERAKELLVVTEQAR